MSSTAYRGRGRIAVGERFVKTTITLPQPLILELDVIVAHYKQADQSFNRSALIQRLVENYVADLTTKEKK
jgi:metal-responsive CopG/Arc/MetJ family transcriptional regulator